MKKIWQSFNKAILLSFPSPERDKECILRSRLQTFSFQKKSTEKQLQSCYPVKPDLSESEATQRRRTSQWREVKSRSSWAPNEDTYYLRFNGANGATTGTVSNFCPSNNMLCQKCVCVCVCFFCSHVFLKTRFFFACFFKIGTFI